jgi:hypothetical protein
MQPHAKALGIDTTDRDFHSFRRSLITFARTDGARTELLERITHNAAGTMIDCYTYFEWDVICDAISALRIARNTGVVVPLRKVANGDVNGDAAGSGLAKASIFNELETEEKGFEDGAEPCRSRPLAESRGRVRVRGPDASREMTRDSASVPGSVTQVTIERAREAVRELRVRGRDALADAIEVLVRAVGRPLQAQRERRDVHA